MDRESFRYYRWRTVFGSRLWNFDMGFYELLGRLSKQDVTATIANELANGFVNTAFGPSKLEQAINAGTLRFTDDFFKRIPNAKERDELANWYKNYLKTNGSQQ